MKKVIVIVIILIAILLAGGLYFMTKGPDLSQFESLKNPRITNLPNQKVVVVEAKGNPNVVGVNAFGLLFKTYFKIKGTAKGPKQPAPRARWKAVLDSAKDTWVGFYAMPVPDQVTELPQVKTESGLKTELTTWDYGDVAEILHIGSYASEKPTVEKLMAFIQNQGYEIIGEHEEEYLKGPGMFLKGDPEKYYTLIRYRVKKKG